MGGTSKLTTVSLFTGAGGLDVGLHRQGFFDLLACVELESRYCETLERNRDTGLFGSKDTQVLCADMHTLDPKELMEKLGLRPGELDVLVGGPPCQSFSTAGRRQSVQDPRGELLWDFLRFVDAFQPKVFLMENVRGLLSAALKHRPIAERPDKGGPPLLVEEMPGSVAQLWANDLSSIPGGCYRVDCFEVNAVNYGAAQLRERALFIGNRFGLVADFPQPTHAMPNHSGAVADGLQPFATLRDALHGLVESPEERVVVDFSPRKKSFLELVPPGSNWRSLPPAVAQESMGKAYFAKGGRSGWWRRLSWDLPSPTVTTLPSHASTSMCHPEETRALSVAECARIQGFPDGWRFSGSASQQMAQVGNAVPAKLGEVAGNVLVDLMRQAEGDAVCPPTAGVPNFRKVYINSHVRTRQWFRDGVVYVWDGLDGTARYTGRSAGDQLMLDLSETRGSIGDVLDAS